MNYRKRLRSYWRYLYAHYAVAVEDPCFYLWRTTPADRSGRDASPPSAPSTDGLPRADTRPICWLQENLNIVYYQYEYSSRSKKYDNIISWDISNKNVDTHRDNRNLTQYIEMSLYQNIELKKINIRRSEQFVKSLRKSGEFWQLIGNPSWVNIR